MSLKYFKWPQKWNEKIFLFDSVVNRVLFNYTLNENLNWIILFSLMQFLDISVFVNCKEMCWQAFILFQMY